MQFLVLLLNVDKIKLDPREVLTEPGHGTRIVVKKFNCLIPVP
jgi:hypothetical protein